MKFRPSARPALGWLIPLALFGLVGALCIPTAHAETALVSSSPANGTTVETSPTQIDLTFSAQLGPTNTISLTCGGVIVPLTAPTALADGLSLTATLVSAAPAGECTVAWTVTATDGQPAGSGSFTFTVAGAADPGAAGGTLDPTASAPTSSVAGEGDADDGGGDATEEESTGGTSSGPLALFRLLSNFGVALLFGAIVIISFAWPEGIEYAITVRYLRSAWIFTAVSTYLFTATAAANVSGDGIGSGLIPTSWGDLIDSTPGKAAFLRIVFVLATAIAVSRPERIIDPAAQFPALVPPGLAVATLGFSRAPFTLVDNAVAVVHALSMGLWLGGVVLLTRVVLAGPGDEDLVHAVRGFSRLSTPIMWVTVATGAIMLFRLDRGAFGTSHGVTVIFKTLLVALMIMVAMMARQFISVRLSRVDVMTTPLASRLRRALGIEAGLGVAVIGLTGVLLTMTPPGFEPDAPPPLQLGVVHIFKNEQLGIDATVAFTETVGRNDVRIELLAVPAGGISGLSVDFIPPTESAVNGMTINVPLTAPGAAVLRKSSNFRLDVAGAWTVRVRVGDQIVANQIVQVSEPTTIVEIPSTGSVPDGSVAASAPTTAPTG